jgi:hypothetical protein
MSPVEHLVVFVRRPVLALDELPGPVVELDAQPAMLLGCHAS